MKKHRLFIILPLLLTFLLCSCGIIKDKTQRQLESLEKEYTQEEPGIVLYGTFMYKGLNFSLNSLVEEKAKITPISEVGYAIYEDKLYFSYVCDSNDIEKPNKWVLAQYDLNTAELKTLYEEKNTVVGHERLYGAQRSNGGMLAKDTIFLIMGSNVVIYSIRDDEIKTTTIFELEITDNYTAYKDKNDKIVVMDSNKEKCVISYSELVVKSPTAAKLSGLKDYKIWNGKNAMDEGIAIIQPEEQAIFIIDTALNKSGHSYAVLYAYIPEKDSYEYINYYYMDDVVRTRFFYVVPIID